MKHWKTLFWVLLLLGCEHRTPVTPNGETQLPQWPMFRHDVRHTGNVNNDPYGGIVGPPGPNISVRWSFDSHSLMVGSPAIEKDGTIYFGTTLFGADSVFYAVNADGALKWKFDAFGRGGTWSSPAIADDGTIYCISRIGTFAFNPDGSLKWKLDRGSEAPGSPALGPEGTLYWCDFQFLNAVNPDGTIKWQVGGGDDFHHPVVGLDGVIYYNYERRTLVAVRPDGSIKWEYVDDVGFLFDSAVIDGDGFIYFLSSVGTLYSIASSGHLRWKIPLLGASGSRINVPAIAADGTIVVVGNDSLYAIFADGRQLWRREALTVSSPPLIDTEGNIYLTHMPGPVQELITSYSITGVLRWRITDLPIVRNTGGTPLGPDGSLFFGSENDPFLYAFH